MQIEVNWRDNEGFLITREQFPRTWQALKQSIHPEALRATRDFTITVLLGAGLMLLGAMIVALSRPVVGGIALLVFLFLFWLIFISIRRSFRSVEVSLGLFNGQNHTYKLEDDGVVQHSPGSTLHIPWSGVSGICVNDQWVITLVRDYSFFLVPVRSFESDDDLEAYLSTIERLAGIQRIDERL